MTPLANLYGLDLTALDRHLRQIGVLRWPPLHGLTPSAHDMAREHTVVAALNVRPSRWTMRNDDFVLGAPFQMVDFVPGRVVRTPWSSTHWVISRSLTPVWTARS